MSEIGEEEIARAIRTARLRALNAPPMSVIFSDDAPAEDADLASARAVLSLLRPAIERAREEVPEGWMLVPIDPKDEHIGANYVHGLWSRRNWEAALEDMAAAAIRKG